MPDGWHREPVAGLRILRDGDGERPVIVVEHRLRIERCGQARPVGQRRVGGVRQGERPEPRLWHLARDPIGAAAHQRLAGIVIIRIEDQPLGAAEQQAGGLGAVISGVRIGFRRLCLRIGLPCAERQRAEAGRTTDRTLGNQDADAEGDRKGNGNEKGNPEHELACFFLVLNHRLHGHGPAGCTGRCRLICCQPAQAFARLPRWRPSTAARWKAPCRCSRSAWSRRA